MCVYGVCVSSVQISVSSNMCMCMCMCMCVCVCMRVRAKMLARAHTLMLACLGLATVEGASEDSKGGLAPPVGQLLWSTSSFL